MSLISEDFLDVSHRKMKFRKRQTEKDVSSSMSSDKISLLGVMHRQRSQISLKFSTRMNLYIKGFYKQKATLRPKYWKRKKLQEVFYIYNK